MTLTMDTRGATNRSEDDEKIVYGKPIETGPTLALPGIDAQACGKDFQGYRDDLASGYGGHA